MSKRILVIDDEIDFTHMVKMLLQMSGPYQVREVHAARAAVAMAREFQPDIILLDCMMPEIDGGEVASRLEADPETSHIPVIFLTATVDQPQELPSRCYTGTRTYLPKPIQLAKLIETIDQAISRKEAAAGTPAEAAGGDAPPPPEQPSAAAGARPPAG
jgi:two-component system, OmpR family, response regulator